MSEGGSWGWTNPEVQPIEQPPSGPSRRHFGLVAMATLAIAVGLLAFTILGANNGGRGGALNPIAQAAERTASFPGERMTISASVTAPGSPISVQLQGRGAFNGKTQRGRIDMTMQGPEPMGTLTLNEVIDGGDLYVGSPELANSLPMGKQWILVDPFSDDAGSSALGQSDPRSQLKALESVSDAVVNVGTESIGGHPTTHYSAELSVSKMADLMRATGDDESAGELEDLSEKANFDDIPIQAWIDRRGLLRRMTMVILIADLEGQQVTMTMNTDFFDYGATPSIQVPSPDQVYDARGVDLEQLSD
jgi:hypothetical protein